MKITRSGDVVLVEKRPAERPRRKSSHPLPVPPNGYRVAAITAVPIRDEMRLCAVLKRPRKQSSLRTAASRKNSRTVTPPPHNTRTGRPCDVSDLAHARARVRLAYGENPVNSPSCSVDLKKVGATRPLSLNRLTGGSSHIPWRYKWILKAWPGVGRSLSATAKRRLARLTQASPPIPTEKGPPMPQNRPLAASRQPSLFTSDSLANLPPMDQCIFVSTDADVDTLLREMPTAIRVLHHARAAVGTPPYSREAFGAAPIMQVVNAAGCSPLQAWSTILYTMSSRVGKATSDVEAAWLATFPSN